MEKGFLFPATLICSPAVRNNPAARTKTPLFSPDLLNLTKFIAQNEICVPTKRIRRIYRANQSCLRHATK